MASNVKNVQLGPCTVTYGGTDLGFTKGGVKVEVKTSTKKVTSDQFGMGTINEVVTQRECTAKVPLSESTIDNIANIMTGAILTKTGGVVASGEVEFLTAPPVNGDTVTVNGVVFTAKTVPVGPHDFAPGATIAAAAANFAAALNGSVDTHITGYVSASASAGVVTLTAISEGAAFNSIVVSATAQTPANLTVVAMAGGVDPTKAKVEVPTGVGTSLVDIAKKLVLHPIARLSTDRSGDFTIPIAGLAGDMTYSFEVENERVFETTFTAYPDSSTSRLFIVGDESAA